MLKLCTSNRLEVLADALADSISTRASPLDQARVVVPSRPLERFVEMRVAGRLGIASGLRFERLDTVLDEFLSHAAGAPLLDRGELEARLLELFSVQEALAAPDLLPVRRWLDAGGPSVAAGERRAVALAEKLAGLFSDYDRTRPELLRSWLIDERDGDATELVLWQSAVFRALRAAGDSTAITRAEALERLAHLPEVALAGPPLHVIGVSFASRTEHVALAALALGTDVHVYALDPSSEFWGDAEAPRAAARRFLRLDATGASRRASTEPDSPISSLFSAEPNAESGLLGGWGRPAREHLAILRELSGWSADERYTEPALTAPCVLTSLQHSLLHRTAVVGASPDQSVRLLACPSVRREVETVAREIWAALATADDAGRPMAFADVAVLLHDEARARYLPHIEAVFGEARAIPWTSRDLPFVGASAIARTALALTTLISSEPTRALLFDVILSPVVRSGHAGASRERWANLVDGVGFLRGLSSADHIGTYVGVGAASLDLEQAIRRLALGALMPGARSGDERFVPTEPPLLPEEIGSSDEGALALIPVLRSLAKDLRFAGAARLGLTEWRHFFSALFTSHLSAHTRSEEAELSRTLGALEMLSTLERPGTVVGVVAAAEIVTRTLSALTTQRSATGAVGVSVGSLRALRALPFRVVFVLGLGEGRFPARGDDTGIDVREGSPRLAGDVSAGERDRLAMLETVLSARDALVLSYVARAEDSGDAISPSSVVLELVAELGAAAPEPERPSLRRHEGLSDATLADRARLAALPAALAEEAARTLGDSERDPAETWPRAADGVFGLSSGDGLRALLSWPRIEPSPPDAAQVLDVSLSQLKAFLERPLQAAAERALGRDFDDDSIDRAEEPLDAALLERLGVIERALLFHSRDGGPGLDARVAHEAQVLRARGRFPLGVLGERETASLFRAADALSSRLAHAARKEPTLPPIFRARLGRGRAAQNDVARVSDPVALGKLKDGREVLLSGETELLFDERKESVVLSITNAGTGKQAVAKRMRVLIRVFVDHAALAAAGLGGDAARTVWLAHPDAVFRGVLEPIDASAARLWLRGIAGELTRGHAAFLPIEAVLDKLDVLRGRSSRPAAELHRAVERVREKDAGGAERFGPVRDAALRDGLDPTSLLRAVGARFGPFVEHLRSLDLVETP